MHRSEQKQADAQKKTVSHFVCINWQHTRCQKVSRLHSGAAPWHKYVSLQDIRFLRSGTCWRNCCLVKKQDQEHNPAQTTLRNPPVEAT